MILKPPRGAILNRTHPLARGLTCFLAFNEATGSVLWNYASQKTSSITGSTWVPGGLSMNGTSSDYVALGMSSLGFIEFPCTFTIIGRHKLNTYSNMLNVAWAGSSSYYAGVRITSANKCNSFTRGSGGQLDALGTVSVVDNERVAITGVQRTTGRTLYAKGEVITNTTSYGAFYWSNVNRFDIGRLCAATTYYYPSNGFEMACIHNRELTATEVWQLHANPYSMFEQDSPAKRFFDIGGAASVVGSRFIYSDIFPVTQLFRGNNL